MPNTIFDKILDGQVPCHKIYEDEWVLAFLDAYPLSEGHTLIIPKKERKAQVHELSDEQSAAIGRVLPRVARAVLQATGARGYNVLQNNGGEAHQAVMHVHFHIIPRVAGKGLGIGWNASALDPTTAPDLAKKIIAALG
jgi:histidine triad (HIT) family protein